MIKQPLTRMQKRVYSVIIGYIQERGISPTYQEVAIRLGLTPQSIDRYVHILQQKGWIEILNTKMRKLKCLPDKK